ncbi:family 16 glycoside hydrolase [Parapedobacter sp. 10938]|uniref:family 16 glycoside hydrolase n=1 Tax=Parapedobacter flavus TaxID=3110225 RepID=UPI002DBD6418|nr:family 16 glycoside hydrolase [Parapedobacter sp. 10938]MEC3879913.1 family 16 glycoside hydrolase [Parapedobacter sp. 10938]
MIRSIVALLALFILQAPVYAQQGDTRTTTTKIADILALQPSETPQRLNDAMGQLERFTAADISALLSQLTPPGQGDNAGIEYATNSYSYHVLLPGKNQQRATFIQGATAALAALDNKDNKGFVIQLLQNAGDDTAVDALSGYLTDDYLSEKAARALARIGTETAGTALLKALPQATGVAEINIINALGFMAYSPAEQSVLAKASATDTNLQKVVLYALSRIGGTASGSVLMDAASAADYAYDPTDATAAYINYLHRLVELGEVKTAGKLASRLFKSTQADSQIHSHFAALELLTKIKGERHVNKLLKAVKDDDSVYRNASLGLLVPYLNDRTTAKLVRNAAKGDEHAQVDILRYLGNQRQTVALPAVRKSLHSTSPAVRIAAVRALHQLDSDAEVKELIPLLENTDGETRAAIKGVLLVSEQEQLIQTVTEALSATKNDDVRMLLIDVLGRRGAGESMPVMLDMVNNDAGDEAKAAAYAALPKIARADDLNSLLGLLVSTDERYIGHVQNAAVVAVDRGADRGSQLQQVITSLKGAGAGVQPHYFPILAGVGGPRALAIVSDYTEGDNPALRRAATSALTDWADAAALPKLVELSRKKVMDSGQLGEVINGLVRIVGIADVPADQKVLYLRDAFEVAQTDGQRKTVLQALQGQKTYQALLFAGQFMDDKELGATATNAVINIALENKQYYGAAVTRLLKKAIARLSGSESSYQREAIQKYLDGLPEGPGYVSLFNGHNLNGWKGLVANPIKRAEMDAKTLAAEQVKADEVMREGWYAEDGVLHFNGHGDNIVAAKEYGDFELLVDWKLDKDGKDGDAGIYLRGTPQVQIWDTSRVNVGAQVGSGGLYNNQTHKSKPLKVADNALGEWNTFRITMIGDKVTVYLNGELVTDNVVLENYWDRSIPIFPTEQLELQAHGTHVMYRDVYVRELPRRETFTLSAEEKAEGFEVLFDGTNLDAWTGNTTAYRVSDEGTLAIYPEEGSGGNLYTKDEFADFIYRFEFRLTPGANNGIGIRAPLDGDAAYGGMEIQVLDNTADMYKNLAEYQYHGSVYGVIPAKRGFLKPMGEWNTEEIWIKGNKIKVTLNGTVIVDGDLAEASKNGTLDKKQHPGLMRTSGHIAFLGHGSEVHFRNIRVKRL